MRQPAAPQQKFNAMTIGGQIAFCLKLSIFFATFGFAYPALLSG